MICMTQRTITITFKPMFMLRSSLFLLNCQLLLCTKLLTFILITSLVSTILQFSSKAYQVYSQIFTNLPLLKNQLWFVNSHSGIFLLELLGVTQHHAPIRTLQKYITYILHSVLICFITLQ